MTVQYQPSPLVMKTRTAALATPARAAAMALSVAIFPEPSRLAVLKEPMVNSQPVIAAYRRCFPAEQGRFLPENNYTYSDRRFFHIQAPATPGPGPAAVQASPVGERARPPPAGRGPAREAVRRNRSGHLPESRC